MKFIFELQFDESILSERAKTLSHDELGKELLKSIKEDFDGEGMTWRVLPYASIVEQDTTHPS